MKHKTDSEYMRTVDNIINELVCEKKDFQKAYNYYNLVMDEKQYKYLETNYGIGNPSSIKFIPLIREHVDAIVGEQLDIPIVPNVTCKDAATVSKIDEERKLNIAQNVYTFLHNRLNNQIVKIISGDQNAVDNSVQNDIDELINDLNYGFTSEYEVAAQNVVQYLLQSRQIDIHEKYRQLLVDILCTGESYFSATPSQGNNNVSLHVYDPRNTFIERNPESAYVKDARKAVVRHWMTKADILASYGKDMEQSDLDKINTKFGQDDYGSYYVKSAVPVSATDTVSLMNSRMSTTNDQYEKYSPYYIPVYDVEWIETDDDFVMQRYHVIRIGSDIYIIYGLDKDVVRTHDNPSYCTLSVNGMYLLNRSNAPYSMVLKCADLQDIYNLLHFYRDNLLANSGSVGDWVDMSMIPTFLDPDPTKRLLKFLAYKKNGVGLLDTSQEGKLSQGQAPINTIFNGFDTTIKAPAIQAIQLAIESTEQECSQITGVFKERLNGIQQRDAVTNVQTSVNNSYTVTKQYSQQMDCIMDEMLLDCLNVAKRVYSNGITGTLILGDFRNKIFTALPQYFTMTDYDVHITNSSQIKKDLEQLRSLLPQFIQSGSVDPEIIVEGATTKSLTELKIDLHNAMRKQKAENSQVQQLTQQLQQAQQQMQQAQNDLKDAQTKLSQYDDRKLKLEEQKVQSQSQIDMYKAKTERNYKQTAADNDNKRTSVQLAQLSDGDPHDDKIVNQQI